MKIGSLLFFINIAAIILSVLAAILAFAFVQAWVKKIPSWMRLIAAWTACGILGIRGCVGIWQTFQLSIHDIPLIFLIFEPLFVAGGVLFGALAVIYRLSQQKMHCPDSKGGPKRSLLANRYPLSRPRAKVDIYEFRSHIDYIL